MRRYMMSAMALILVGLLNGVPAGRAETPDALMVVGSTQLQVPYTFDHSRFALWSGGEFLLVEDRHSSFPTIHILDPKGAEISTFTFSIPGAGPINLWDNSVARGSDGSLALIGTTYFNDSTGVMFVAWVSPDGKEQTIIRTTPFYPRAVTVASDGTIWVAGDVHKGKPEKPDYSQELIRRYDKTGKLLGSFIAWSSLGTNPRIIAPTPVIYSVLLSLKDRVGWYSPASETYIEFSLEGSVISRFLTAPHSQEDVITVALCEGGGLFASTKIVRGEERNWGIFTLNRQRGDWTLVPRNEQWGMLFGCDGTRIASSTDSSTVSWLEPTTK
jgi:hypothetical protein